MKNIFILMFASILIVFSSCDEDFFETSVELEIPDHTPTIALTGVVKEGAELFETYVSFSQSKNAQAALTPLHDAEVRLLKDGNLLAELNYDLDTEKFFAPLTSTDLVAGSTYRIEANHPDYESVFAEQTIPSPITIDEFKFDSSGTVDQFGEQADQLKLTITDRPGETNYYAVIANRSYRFFNDQDTVSESYPFELMTLDPSIVFGYSPDNYSGIPMISDAVFPGKKYDLIFNTYQLFLDEGDELTIELKTITRERYVYLLSLKGYFDSEDNPFAEPVTVLSNIENGNGAFGAEAVSRITYKHQ